MIARLQVNGVWGGRRVEPDVMLWSLVATEPSQPGSSLCLTSTAGFSTYLMWLLPTANSPRKQPPYSSPAAPSTHSPLPSLNPPTTSAPNPPLPPKPNPPTTSTTNPALPAPPTPSQAAAAGSRKRHSGGAAAAGEEDAFYRAAKAARAATKSEKRERHQAPALEPPLPDESVEGQRPISYAIRKNRGLTPHRWV